MNSVQLIGRLTKDPEIRYSNSGMCFATFTVAIDRPPKKDGTKETDFPRVKAIGKLAENAEKYLYKGRLVGVSGSIETGSYEDRDGNKVYTTDVFANRIEYLSWEREGGGEEQRKQEYFKPIREQEGQVQGFGFSEISDESIPF